MASFIQKGWWMLKTFKNPISILLFNQGFSNDCTFKFRDPKVKNLYLTNDYKELALFLSYWRSKESFSDEFLKFINEFDINNEFFEYDGLICKGEPSSWIFVESDDYLDKFSIKNRTVIDIGGNVGDTALKFAKNGAIVYAFEPMPHIYETAIENINLNPEYKNKIHFYNKAVSHKRGELTFFKDNLNTGGHSQFQEGENSEKIIVDSITIDDAIKDFNIKPDILKIDCEGCEYNIILNCNLDMFNDIILEYHQELMKKPYTLLVDELKKQGFNVKIFHDNPKDAIGVIYAYKSPAN